MWIGFMVTVSVESLQKKMQKIVFDFVDANFRQKFLPNEIPSKKIAIIFCQIRQKFSSIS